MKKFLFTFLMLVCSFLIASSVSATLVNPGFEDGSLGWTSAGNVFFSPFVVGNPGIPPPDGSKMPTEGYRFVQLNNGFPGGADSGCCIDAGIIESVLLIDLSGTGANEGSYIYQDYNFTAGTQIAFDWNFLTDEVGEGGNSTYNDFAIASLNELGTDNWYILADTFDAIFSTTINGTYTVMTGNQTTYFNAPFTGIGRLGFAILDAGSTQGQSALYMDNVRVPEPGTFMLLGFGILGLAGLTFRRRFKK